MFTLKSIGARLAILIAVILGASTLAVSLFSSREVERSMLDASEESVVNMHRTVQQMLAIEYRNLEDYREAAMTMRREQLQNVSATLVASLDVLRAAEITGQIAPEVARETALDVLRGVRFFNNDYFFTYDREMTAIAHPDPTIEGRNLIDFQDPHGKYVLREIRDVALVGGGFVDYWWKRLETEEAAPKLGYVFHYPSWDWIIGTGVYIDDIDAEVSRRFAEMTQHLSGLFDRVSLSSSGFFFVVDDRGRVVVAPASRDLSVLGRTSWGLELMGTVMSRISAGAERAEMTAQAAFRDGRMEPWEIRATFFEPLGWYLVSAVARAEMEAHGERLAVRQIALNLVVLAIGLLVAGLLVSRVIRGLRRLTEHARLLPTRDFAVAGGESGAIAELAARHSDEVGRLAEAFVFLERELGRYIANLTETTRSKERIESELRIAHDIQMGLLPKLFPAFPDRPEFDIYAEIVPAREVGGDLYDFFLLDRDRFCFVIGDVSGKGVPAAFFMAVTKTLFRAIAESGGEIGEVLSRVNDDLSEENESSMFVTLFCGVLDIPTGEIAYACAGHNPPVLLRQGEAPVFLPSARQPVGGAMEGIAYMTQRLVLAPGDLLFMYTDGVNEAMDAAGVIYGDPRLLEVVVESGATTPTPLIKAVMADVRRHAGAAEQSDDITAMALQYAGPAI